jgi:formylglycine-generating enzyme required for sulfatase activity
MSVSGFNPAASPSYHATFTADYYLGIYPMTIAQSKLFWTHNPMSERSDDQSRWNGPDTQQTPCVWLSYRDMRGEGKGFNWPTNAVVDGRTVDAAEVDDDFSWGNTKRRTCISQLREISGLKRIDLPTRAQWEYAARAGCPFNFYQLPGDIAYDDLSGYNVAGSREKAFAERIGWTEATAILDGNRGFRTVGLKEPNAWGIYDLIGNCSELVLDRYGDVPYAGKTQTDPRGAETGDGAVKIGNYCVSTPNTCCLWSVSASPRTTRDTTMGVRFCVPVDLLK